ncbi:MAG TPA: PBP1A family penicillin-binding protein [Thermoanaerobaculia bacterium]|nr:PBP1A family penicillin-binding protein [Thermoanaerobaculia bacterium]
MQAHTRLEAFRHGLAELPPGRRRLLIAALAVSCLLFLAGFLVTGYLWHLARQFPEAPFAQPSRLYGRATQLVPGEPLTVSQIVSELRQAGYRELGKEERTPLRQGTFRRQDNLVEVHLRSFPTPQGKSGGIPLRVEIRNGRIAELSAAGQPAEIASLEPPLLASFYGPDLNERRPVALDELPEHVVRAILAAEDDNFFGHPGISPTGTARALWVNLRGGSVQQGGSTITQQLVKNLYLSRERTIERKVKEALIAVMLEMRYGKRTILEAYLNEVYWGRSGPANVIGLGAAARAWFGKDASELSLAEAATLAAMIRAPSDYSPVKDADKVVDRRNWVIQRMAELGWITPDRARRASSEPLRPDPHPVEARPLAPYFTRFAAEEAKERFGIEDLPDEGYLLFSTLGWREQREAERAVAQGLATLEAGWERRGRSDGPLQAALVSVDPRNGAILSWVGGRDFAKSQFDRVSQARRQAGSTFKPVIYAAAFREAVASPATLLRDSPILVRVGTTEWRPQNNDRGFRGWVTVRAALEQSLNIPTVRMALQVGLPRVIETAKDLGISEELEPNPALALGAFEVTPFELAQVYSTLANGGTRPSLHGLAAVHDRFGEPVLGDDLPAPRRVLPPQAAWLVTSILQGVMDRGTGAGVRRFGIRDQLAGKTGTTNDRRDSWFAGYTPDRVTVVWVGYDDNAETRLSGARAALPIWSRFVAAVRPARGFAPFAPPPGIVQVTVDPLTGQLATPYCPYRITEQFAEWQVPNEPCQRHSPGGTDAWADINLNGVPIDPATGRPLAASGWDPSQEYGIDPAGFDQTYGSLEEDGAVDAGVSAAGIGAPGQTFSPRPVEIDPGAADTTGAADGSILIRPARQEPEPVETPEAPEAEPPAAEPPPAPEPPPVEPLTEATEQAPPPPAPGGA